MAEGDPSTWNLLSSPTNGNEEPITCGEDGCKFGLYELDSEEGPYWRWSTQCFACVSCNHEQAPIASLQPDSGAPKNYQRASALFMATCPDSTLPDLRRLGRPEVKPIDYAIGKFGIKNTVEF